VDRIGQTLGEQLSVPAGVTATQRLDHAQRLLATSIVPIMPAITPAAGAGFLARALARKLAGDCVEHGEWDEMLRGLPHNVTTEMDLELWGPGDADPRRCPAAAALQAADFAVLAQRYARRDLPPRLQQGLEDLLARHGHRAVAEIDVGMPRWSDDPTYVLGVLANYLRLEDPDLAPNVKFSEAAGPPRPLRWAWWVEFAAAVGCALQRCACRYGGCALSSRNAARTTSGSYAGGRCRGSCSPTAPSQRRSPVPITGTLMVNWLEHRRRLGQ